jgi:AcrR family transcriptional regulator
MEARRKKPARPARPKRGKAYHHGDLATALVEAAEAVLTERGVEGFTLRECARRAGVSHAAPAHHFGDIEGLLTEVAAVGFDRLTEAQREAAKSADPRLRLVEAGAAYVRFALAHPAQFRLMFFPGMLDRKGERFAIAGRAAFSIFLETYSAATGRQTKPLTPREAGSDPDVLRQWAVVHGLATLAIEGQLGPANGAAAERIVRIARKVLESG